MSWRMSKPAEDLPAFFKVYIPEHSSEKMEIPRVAIEPMGLNESSVVSLIGPCGKCWRVEVARQGKELVFDQGWKAFVNDHHLLIGEFLLFRLTGNSSFKVLVLDYSACEKESAFSAQCSQRIADPKKKQKRLVESRKLLSAKSASSLDIVKLGSGSLAYDHGSSEQLQLMKLDHVLPSGNPHFDVRMRNYHVSTANILHIPATFVKKNGLAYCKKEKMILQTTKGAWPVNVIPMNKSYDFCGGWSNFARQNNIQEGDICRFELLDRLEMIVHIFRSS